MRIGINAQLLAFSADYRQAGLSRYIYEQTLRLPALLSRDEFTAFVGSWRLPDDFLAAVPANLRINRSRVPTEKAPIRITWEQSALPLACLASRLDLLFCPVNIRPIAISCPAVITIHDLIFLRYPANFHPLKRLYLATLTGWSARHAEHIIAVSEATRQDIISMLKVPAARVSTVHNGVSSRFHPISDEARGAFIREKGLQGRTILYLGTLEPRKNITTIINAFASLAAEPDFSDVNLLIGGSKGWYYEEIFSAAERCGLAAAQRVRFLGRVPDDELPLWYNIASIFAYPSLYEGFGLPPLEAMACGTPVVASDRSAMPEVIGDSGLLVDPENTRAWTTAFDRLLRNEALAAELAQRGPLRASQFTWEKSARATAQVIKRSMEGGRHSGIGRRRLRGRRRHGGT